MKKLTTAVTRKGVEKRIEVLIEDEIAHFLEENVDEVSRRKFIVEEYKAQLIERRETRRHQSLEKSIENGHEFVDDSSDITEIVERREEVFQLCKGLKALTQKQLYVLKLHVLEHKTFREISEEMGLNLYTIYEHYTTAKKKLKKFFS